MTCSITSETLAAARARPGPRYVIGSRPKSAFPMRRLSVIRRRAIVPNTAFFTIFRQTTSCLDARNAIAMASVHSRQLMRAHIRPRCPPPTFCHARMTVPSRTFSSSRTAFDQQNFHRKESFRSRLNSALKGTKIKWEPIPIALGIGFLGAFQLYRIQRREKHTEAGANKDLPDEVSVDSQSRPKKRERIRPSGPWSACVFGAAGTGC
jgi:hypothetical protein